MPRLEVMIWDSLRLSVDSAAKSSMTKLDMLSRQPHIPEKPVHTQKQPDGLVEGLTLHKYQSDCVSWMKSIEISVKSQRKPPFRLSTHPSEFVYSPYTFWKNTGSSLVYDPVTPGTFAHLDKIPKFHCSAAGKLLFSLNLTTIRSSTC